MLHHPQPLDVTVERRVSWRIPRPRSARIPIKTRSGVALAVRGSVLPLAVRARTFLFRSAFAPAAVIGGVQDSAAFGRELNFGPWVESLFRYDQACAEKLILLGEMLTTASQYLSQCGDAMNSEDSFMLGLAADEVPSLRLRCMELGKALARFEKKVRKRI